METATNGKLDPEDELYLSLKNSDDPHARDMARRMLEGTEQLRRLVSPKGKLKLPPGLSNDLLEERRIKYDIVDRAFRYQAIQDRVFIWQISDFETETYGDSSIIMPENARQREHIECPRGVLLSAGPLALDNLRSNGIDIGHIVTFIRNAPFQIRCASVSGKDYYVMVMRDGDIAGSEDLWDQLCDGKVSLKTEELIQENSAVPAIQHLFVDENGKQWAPQKAWIADDL